MENKTCIECGLEKSIVEFYKSRNKCKECFKKQVIELQNKNKQKYKKNRKEYFKKYRKNHPEKIKEKNKKYREIHKNEAKKYSEEYRKTHKEYFDNYFQKYRLKNKRKIIKTKNNKKIKKEKIKKAKKIKTKEEKELIIFKKQIRCLISKSFSRKKYIKELSTKEILGCDFYFLYKHLMQTYKNNYNIEYDGIEKVHIDHIIPLATANTKEEVMKLCHYTNLQLLKAKDNIHKSSKLDWKLVK